MQWEEPHHEEGPMIILGIILFVAGVLLGVNVLTWLGAALVVLGAILAILTITGRGPDRYWY